MSTTIKRVILALAVIMVAGILAYSTGFFQRFSSSFKEETSSGVYHNASVMQPEEASGARFSSTRNDLRNTSQEAPPAKASHGASEKPHSIAPELAAGEFEGDDKGRAVEGQVPSVIIPDLVEPPIYEGKHTSVEKDGKVVRLTVGEQGDDALNGSTILGTTSLSDGATIPSSQDTVIPLSLIHNVARDAVNGYWPKGTHVLATSHGITTSSFAFLNARYGATLLGKMRGYTETGTARQGLLEYILMPSMVDGLYKLYAERFIRLMNQEAEKRLYARQGATASLENSEIAEMFGLYARSLRSSAGCMKAFVSSAEIRQITEKFIVAEFEASEANMRYQEEAITAENSGAVVSRQVEQLYRVKVAERESARQNLAASFRRFTDTRNMDTSDLVFLAKWLNRRSIAHDDGLLALASTLESLAARMEREQQRYINK